MAGGRFFGLASHRIRPQNGWQISSRKQAAGNRLPAIWSAIGTGSLVSSSSEDFGQWVFAIDRRRHVPHGKTDLLSDSSVRSDGSALTMLLCSASGISVTLSYMKYYNEVRTHLSLEKDAPVTRAVAKAGRIIARPILGGLHHQYARI